MGVAVQRDVRAFKETYEATGEIKASALAAGYSQHTANQGLRSLPKVITQFVERKQRKASKLRALAQSIDADYQADLMRGAIFDNVITGKDKACNSIRLGMQDKRVSMLQAESQTGIIVIQPPPAMMEAIQARILALTPDAKSLTIQVDTEPEPSKP